MVSIILKLSVLYLNGKYFYKMVRLIISKLSVYYFDVVGKYLLNVFMVFEKSA